MRTIEELRTHGTCRLCGGSLANADLKLLTRRWPYCCEEHTPEYRAAHARDRVCAVCGTTFQSSHTKAIYCSEDCMKLGNKQRVMEGENPIDMTGQEIMTKTCKTCGKEFQTNVRSQFYCSPECRLKGQQKTPEYTPEEWQMQKQKVKEEIAQQELYWKAQEFVWREDRIREYGLCSFCHRPRTECEWKGLGSKYPADCRGKNGKILECPRYRA